YFSRALKQGIADPNSAQYNRPLAADTHLRLAQSYEATRDARAAAGAYKRYLALEPSAKRAEIENRIRTLESAKPVFQAPRLSPRMAEEARKPVRLNAPTPAQPPRAVLKGPEKLVRPPVAPAPAVQPSPRTVIAAAPQAVKPPEKLVRPSVAPAPAA